jgi:hypothetical protein
MLEPNISDFCPFKNRNRLQKLKRCGQEIKLNRRGNTDENRRKLQQKVGENYRGKRTLKSKGNRTAGIEQRNSSKNYKKIKNEFLKPVTGEEEKTERFSSRNHQNFIFWPSS